MSKKDYTTDEVALLIARAFEKGVRHAAEIANHYNGSTTHPYMLGDCILAKLNRAVRSKPRKNKVRLLVSKK